jgi:2-polyprenyl-6-methoxyphenol hydroxylase-like FAD-dependent oxidoreductase
LGCQRKKLPSGPVGLWLACELALAKVAVAVVERGT